jgi:hypothetical protein
MTEIASSSRVRLHPVNTAEAVIMAFFDHGLSPEKEWVLEPGPGTRELRMGFGYSTHISWESATPGVPAYARLQRSDHRHLEGRAHAQRVSPSFDFPSLVCSYQAIVIRET